MGRRMMDSTTQLGQTQFPGSGQWGFRVHTLLDEAIHILTHRGFIAVEEEAVDLLEAAGTVQDRDGQRLILHASALRKVLEQLPSAFNLFDRQGAKVRTVAGGVGAGKDGALHATVVDTKALARTSSQASSRGRVGACHSEECSVDATCQTAGVPWVPKAADLPGITRNLASLPGFDLLGAIPHPSGMPQPLGLILRLYLALLYSSRPQLLRPRDGAVLDDLRALLCALRGSVAAVEEKPLVILEAIASEPLKWNAVACRILIDGARRGFPIAPVAALPRNGGGSGAPSSPLEAPGNWASESVATLLAAVLIHQLARERAPLLWGVPFIQPLSSSPSWSEAWRLCLAAGDQLGLPSLATVGTETHGVGTAAPLWATQAAFCGAQIIAWGGLSDSCQAISLPALERHAALLPEVRRAGLLAALPMAPTAIGRAQAHKTLSGGGPEMPALQDDPLSPGLLEAMEEVLRRVATRHGVADLPLRPGAWA